VSGRFAFRTPTLRNVTLTAPYMHDGVFETLEEVVQFYNNASKPRHPKVTDNMLHPVLRDPLGLTKEEVDQLVDFMKALEDNGSLLDPKLMEVPTTVPSGMLPLNGAVLTK
jgi:cytochrome c peroxidase